MKRHYGDGSAQIGERLQSAAEVANVMVEAGVRADWADQLSLKSEIGLILSDEPQNGRAMNYLAHLLKIVTFVKACAGQHCARTIPGRELQCRIHEMPQMLVDPTKTLGKIAHHIYLDHGLNRVLGDDDVSTKNFFNKNPCHGLMRYDVSQLSVVCDECDASHSNPMRKKPLGV